MRCVQSREIVVRYFWFIEDSVSNRWWLERISRNVSCNSSWKKNREIGQPGPTCIDSASSRYRNRFTALPLPLMICHLLRDSSKSHKFNQMMRNNERAKYIRGHSVHDSHHWKHFSISRFQKEKKNTHMCESLLYENFIHNFYLLKFQFILLSNLKNYNLIFKH